MEKPIPVIRDKIVAEYVSYLEEQLKKFQQSPYVDAYLTLLRVTSDWNAQIQSQQIDLFGDKDEKQFDRAHKYLVEQRPYYEQMEYFRNLMSPEQRKELDKKIKDQNLGMAEKIAINGKDKG